MSGIGSLIHQSDSYSDYEIVTGVMKDEEAAVSSDVKGDENKAVSCSEVVKQIYSEGNFDSDIEENSAGDDDDEDIYDSTSIPKLQFRNDLWQARWNKELSMAEVLKNKGKMATTTGVTREGKLFCSIEESVFLSERGALSLVAPDAPVSLQDLYKMIGGEACGCSWELLEAYRHLKSLGYIVVRRGVPWTMKSKKNLNPTPGHEAAFADNSPIKEELEHDFSALSLDDHTPPGELKPHFDVHLPSSKFKKSSPGDPSFKLYVCRVQPPSKHDIEILKSKCEGIPLKICHVDHGRVSYLAFSEVQVPELP